jgi:single-strand DNA-binding protein
MLNQCQFIGNLGADPEIRSMNNGDKVANMRIACTEKWKDKNSGERREKTEWVSIAVFGPLVNVVENYLKKGSKVFVSGKFSTRKWQDQSGNDRYSTEIVLQGFGGTLVMLDSKGSSGGGSGS